MGVSGFFVACVVVASMVVACVIAVWLALRSARCQALSREILSISNTLVAGDPRRSRALARLHARRTSPEARARLLLLEANALLWEGEFARGFRFIEQRVVDAPGAAALGAVPFALQIECLLFDEHDDEAAKLFDAHAEALAATRDGDTDVAVITGILAFARGDLEKARMILEHAPPPPGDPIFRAAQFWLAAIAHRQRRLADARQHLERCIVGAGDLFIGRWAVAQWQELFGGPTVPERTVPKRPRVRRRRRSDRRRSTGRLLVWFAGGATLVSLAFMAVCSWLGVPHLTVVLAPFDSRESEMTPHARRARVFEQADLLHAAEAALEPERPGVVDLYFVGAAGWAGQDVFRREVQSARDLFDDAFDTSGRSLLLINDPTTQDELPLASPIGLRHALEAVGHRMNPDEDILFFFFFTSHGSERGLALEYPPRSGFDDGAFAPSALASMLDSAKIRWRVLVISGCKSGVFIDALRNDSTLVVTAAARDRNSYGCAMGNAFTDFGRELFVAQLSHEPFLPAAFASAVRATEAHELDAGLRLSRPQLFEGREIGAKLRELESRLRHKTLRDGGLGR